MTQPGKASGDRTAWRRIPTSAIQSPKSSNPEVKEMNEDDIKMLIAQLMQDAQRIQQIEPNAGTAARIEAAKKALTEKFSISE
ncbi:hypothetical protein [Erwinia sp. 9145]|uniref:hypothetical protein n=1 Tax=Erwinia sp. 9145 TaxID=1500895 RepID=UPI0012E07C47|nr:hypothetical protein [Erwinia sp. 9145]